MVRADALRPIVSGLRDQRLNRLAFRLSRWMIIAAAALLLAVALLIAQRRLAGAWTTPVGTGVLFAVAGAMVALASSIRAAAKSAFPSWPALPRIILQLLPAFAMAIAATALSLPEKAPAGVAALWAIVVLHEAAWLAAAVRAMRGTRIAQQAARVGIHAMETATEAPSISDQDFAGHLTQQISRATDEQGAELIFGTLTATFQPAQRSNNLHIAFCPPLSGAPSLSAEQVSGPDASVSIAEVQSYGARIDLRLRRVAAETVDVQVEFSARGPK